MRRDLSSRAVMRYGLTDNSVKLDMCGTAVIAVAATSSVFCFFVYIYN